MNLHRKSQYLFILEREMNRRWTKIHADNQRVVLIWALTQRVNVQFFVSLLTSMFICVYLRFIFLFRFIRGFSRVVIFLIIFVQGCGYYPPSVSSQKEILGLDQSHVFLYTRALADSDLSALESRQNLQMLSFSAGHAVVESKITDRGLQTLSSLNLPNLRLLDLGNCDGISDKGLIYIRRMKSIKRLSLSSCQGISDTGIRNLQGMNHLAELDLRGCQGITDRGIADLAIMKNLRWIQLGGCLNVTDHGVRKLQRHLPNAKVEKDEKEWSFHQN